MIDGKNFFDQPIDSMAKTYENTRKIAIGNYKIIAIDLSKQQELDAYLKAIQQIKFTANLDRNNGATMFFIIEEVKETVFEFSQGTIKVL